MTMADIKKQITLLVGLTVLCFGTGCAFTPTPVRLTNKPHMTDKQSGNGIRIVIIVKDERPESIQKAKMCGLMRNLYMMPTSFAFLAHSDKLDRIISYHMRRNFEHLGYTVVAAYPASEDELDAREVSHKELDDATSKTAWTQKDSQLEKREKRTEATVEGLEETYLSQWGPSIDVRGADYVVELKVRKFFSDAGWGIDVSGVYAWASANLAICRADDDSRKVLYGRKVKGFGHGRGFTPIEAYNIPLNMAYWFMMHSVEKLVASEEFMTVIQSQNEGSLENH
jgi:hypothetical protein